MIQDVSVPSPTIYTTAKEQILISYSCLSVIIDKPEYYNRVVFPVFNP